MNLDQTSAVLVCVESVGVPLAFALDYVSHNFSRNQILVRYLVAKVLQLLFGVDSWEFRFLQWSHLLRDDCFCYRRYVWGIGLNT